MRYLRQLRKDAQSWWWHKELRNRGHVEEARALERASIRSSVRTLRAATSWEPNSDGTTTINTGPIDIYAGGYTVCGGYRNGQGLASIARETLPMRTSR